MATTVTSFVPFLIQYTTSHTYEDTVMVDGQPQTVEVTISVQHTEQGIETVVEVVLKEMPDGPETEQLEAQIATLIKDGVDLSTVNLETPTATADADVDTLDAPTGSTTPTGTMLVSQEELDAQVGMPGTVPGGTTIVDAVIEVVTGEGNPIDNCMDRAVHIALENPDATIYLFPGENGETAHAYVRTENGYIDATTGLYGEPEGEPLAIIGQADLAILVEEAREHGNDPAEVRAAAAARGVDPDALGVRGNGGAYVGTNIPDIGMLPPETIDNIFWQLSVQGIDHVRVFPFWGADHDPATAQARLQNIVDAAERWGINLTVDLFDANGARDQAGLEQRAAEQNLLGMIDTLVPAFARYGSRITWSVGNEIQAGGDPLATADWYVSMVSRIRSHDRDARVSLEIIPRAVGDAAGETEAAVREARRRMVAVSNVVSIHFYPYNSPEYAENLLAGEPIWDNDNPDSALYWDYRALLEWQALAGSKFRIGEFAIDGDPSPSENLGPYRTNEAIGDWLHHLRDDLRIFSVLLWNHGAVNDQPGNHSDNIGYDWIGADSDVSLYLFEEGFIDNARP